MMLSWHGERERWCFSLMDWIANDVSRWNYGKFVGCLLAQVLRIGTSRNPNQHLKYILVCNNFRAFLDAMHGRVHTSPTGTSSGASPAWGIGEAFNKWKSQKEAPKEAPAPQEARLQFDKVCHVGLTCAYLWHMCMLANFANTTQWDPMGFSRHWLWIHRGCCHWTEKSLEVWASAVCRLEYHTSASSVAHFSTMTYCIILPSPDISCHGLPWTPWGPAQSDATEVGGHLNCHHCTQLLVLWSQVAAMVPGDSRSDPPGDPQATWAWANWWTFFVQRSCCRSFLVLSNVAEAMALKDGQPRQDSTVPFTSYQTTI